MSDANNEISKTANIQGRTALGLTLGLACSIPLSTNAALAAGNNNPHVARQNMQLLQQRRAERRQERLADRADRMSSLSIQNAVQGANFNLNSGREMFSANNLGNFQSLMIDVGGKQRVVTLDSKLSAAEVVAAQQVLNGGVQTIELRANGAASGGTINLNNSTLSALDKSAGGSIGSLTVARNVEVVDSTSGINLSGTLRNLGTISAASNVTGSTVTISADTIHNSRNGSIGSYVGSDFFSADVALNAATSLTNNGSISSAGVLTITAPVINNLNDASNATLSAGQSVNLNTQNLVNTGAIAANAGNINIASTTVLNVLGTGGSLQAKNGSINFAGSDINVTGSNLLSQDVNLTAGSKGTVDATVTSVDGTVNASGCIVHFYTETGDLKLGDIDASGDPIFTAPGSIQITGAIAPTNGNPLTIIAGGDITASAVPLSTAGVVDGGDMTLIAGVQFKTVGGNINVTKKSTTGGKIDLTGITSITSAGGTGEAGDITMVAFAANKTVGSGTITIPTGITVDATGPDGNGNVLLLGSAKTGAAHNVGGITAGDITIKSSIPTFSKGGITYDGATGALISGTFNSTKLTSGDINLNGTIDATGNIFIGTTTAVNINGTVKGSSTNAQQITIQSGNLNLNAGGSLLSNDDSTVTITTSQPFVVSSLISVGTLNLTAASLDITATGSLQDRIDNITTKGNITVNGTLGRNPVVLDPTRPFTTFNITSGGTFVIGDLNAGAVVSGDGKITAKSFTNNTLAKGNTTYTATGSSGVLFDNKGTVDGQIVTITAQKGTINNAVGAILQATQQTLPTDVPVLTLNTLAVNNLGHIEAVGELKRSKGILNINSQKALLITGVDGGFFTDFNSSVNLSALKGDVTVGGNNGVINSNPFSALATGLGSFSVVAPKGEFNTTMPGVSVTADKEGKQGELLFTVRDIVYNGLGAAPNFALKSVGDVKSKGTKVLTFNTTAKKGITIGNGAGEISVDISGYESTSTTTITTPQNMVIDTTALKLGLTAPTSTGLTLTGTKNLLVTGGIVGGDVVIINTGAKKVFQIGNATKTGFNGLAPGEGITAIKSLLINGSTKGFVMAGSSFMSAETVTLNGPSLEVQAGSDIDGLDLNLVPGAAKFAKYANFNPLGAISAARLHINTTGTLTLDSGGGKTVETFLTVGDDRSSLDPGLWEGGTFDLDAAKFAFSTKGITFNAPGNAVAMGGGQVDLHIFTTKATKVGMGNGAIRAIVSSFGGKFPAEPGEFRLATTGAITADNVVAGNVIKYEEPGNTFFSPGVLELISSTSTVVVSGVSNFSYNLFHVSTNSSTPLLATGATKNGVQDANTYLGGGNLDFENFGGKLVSNGVQLEGVLLHLGSTTEIDLRKNAGVLGGFTVFPSGPPEQQGGRVVYDSPLFTLDGALGHHIRAIGGVKSGGDITINGTAGTQTIKVDAPNTGGAFSFDVSDFQPDQGGRVTINSGGAITANGSGFDYGLVGVKNSALNLRSGGVVVNAKGFPISFSNASAAVMTGLDLGTVTIDSGSINPFKLDGANPNANGFTVGNISAGKLVIRPQSGVGIIDTTGYQAIVHDLDLFGDTINFANQTISVVADGAIGTGSFTGDGGKITVTGNTFNFNNAGGVVLQALGTGTENGGIINVNQTSLKTLDVKASTFNFDVSNPLNKGGTVGLKASGDMTVDGNVFTYGDLDGGKLFMRAEGNLLLSNVANISSYQLDQIGFTNAGVFNKGSEFQFGGAGKNGNGIVDIGATLTASVIKIDSTGLGAGVDTTGGTILANQLTISTSGDVNFGSGSTLAVAPSTVAGLVGNGGTLEISANGFTQSGGTAGYTLDASGLTGSGGVISVTLKGSNTLIIGDNDLNLNISNFNGTRGGSAVINNGGSITANIKNINVGANFGGAGPNLALNAKGILAVNNVADIENVGFGGGTITTATIGGVPTDTPPPGYTDSINIFDPALPGGVVTITYVEKPGDTNASIAEFFRDQIANNPDLQNLGLSATVSGTVVTLISASNNTTYTETWTSPPPPADPLSPSTITLLSTTTGLTLTSQSSQPFVLGGAAPGTNGIQDNNLNLNIGAVTIGNTGSQVLLTVGGGQRGGIDTVTVTDPNLVGGALTVSYQVAPNQSKESIALGLANAINVNLALQAIGVSAVVDGASVSLISSGVATTFSAVPAKGSKLTLETLSTGGNIVMGTMQNISGSITDVVSLSASGDVGTKLAPILINGNDGQAITVNAGDDAYFSSTFGASTVTLGTFGHTEALFLTGDIGNVTGNAGDLLFQYSNANPLNTNKVAINSLSTSNGDLFFSSNAQTLDITGQVKSNFGNIILQNRRAGGLIAIGDGTTILGSGAVTALNQGNVYILANNTFPITTAPGVAPAVTINETGGAKVTFGTVANPGGTITADPSVILQALGRNLAFDNATGTITVGKDAVITADPPPLSAGAVQILGANARTTSTTSGSAAIEATPLATSSAVEAGASNVVPSATQPGSVNVPNFTIDSSQNLLSALSTINTIGLNNAQQTDLSSVQNAMLNAIEVSNSVALLSTGGVAEAASLPQINEVTQSSDTESRTLVGQVSTETVRKLDRGPLLVAPENDIVVETPFGKINVAAKTLALLVASESSVAVYNLHDVRKGALTVTTNHGHTFNLTPGTSAVLVSSHDKSFEDVNPAQFVRYRKPISKALTNTHKLYRAEFEILSLLNGLPAFKELIQSENKETRKTMLNVLKTAAILMQLSGNSEPFKFFSKPEVTAMNNGH